MDSLPASRCCMLLALLASCCLTSNATGAAAEQQTLHLPAAAVAANYASGSIYFVGTATVILRYAGFTILTDPNFLHKGDHVHLGYGLTSERLTQPAISFEQLPQIDLVLLSHLHGDHFDQLVTKKLDREIPIVTTPAAARKLRAMGFKAARGLARWESLLVTKGDSHLQVSAMPGRHGPAVVALALPEVMGSLLQFSHGGSQTTYRMYITGDTLMYDDLKEIPRRYPEIDLALLHLGGTRVMGILVTMDAQQGVDALRLVNPQVALPIHYNDYDVFKSPLADFQAAVKAAGLERKVRYLAHSETYRFSAREAGNSSRNPEHSAQ